MSVLAAIGSSEAGSTDSAAADPVGGALLSLGIEVRSGGAGGGSLFRGGWRAGKGSVDAGWASERAATMATFHLKGGAMGASERRCVTTNAPKAIMPCKHSDVIHPIEQAPPGLSAAVISGPLRG